MERILCPEPGCAFEASIIHEDTWPSTDGAVVMAKVMCPAGHWFNMPWRDLPVALLTEGGLVN